MAFVLKFFMSYETTCPECGSQEFILDSERGESICHACGYIRGRKSNEIKDPDFESAPGGEYELICLDFGKAFNLIIGLWNHWGPVSFERWHECRQCKKFVSFGSQNMEGTPHYASAVKKGEKLPAQAKNVQHYDSHTVFDVDTPYCEKCGSTDLKLIDEKHPAHNACPNCGSKHWKVFFYGCWRC